MGQAKYNSPEQSDADTDSYMGLLLLTWVNFNPCMDK